MYFLHTPFPLGPALPVLVDLAPPPRLLTKPVAKDRIGWIVSENLRVMIGSCHDKRL